MGQADRGKRWNGLTATCACAAALLLASPVAEGRRVFMNGMIGTTSVQSTEDGDAPKTNGFSVKKEDQKIIEQFEDFERFRDKKAWDRAFTSLNKLFDNGDSGAMSPTKEGFWVPTRQKLLQTLLALPPEGREAYHLFYDSQAKQQWEQVLAHEAAGDADTVAQLRKSVDRYFISDIGDQLADHLGDALFEAGDFAGAARAWEQILTSYPETPIAPLRLRMKQATALARSGRMEAFRQLAAVIREKHPGEVLRIAGRNVPVDEQLSLLAKPSPTTVPATVAMNPPSTQALASSRPSGAVSSEVVADLSPLPLPTNEHPLWQMVFMDTSLQEKIFQAVNQNGWGQQMGGMARVVPTTITDGKRVYLNWYGILWAIDIETGKMLWWSDHFKKLSEKFNEMIQWQLDSSRFTLTLAGDSLLVVTVNLDKLNNQEPFRLMSVDPSNGKKKWSTDSGPLSGWAFIGSPLVVDSTIYIIAHPKDTQENHVLSLSLDGKLNWESKLGQPTVANNYRGQPIYPVPVLKIQGGTMFVMTNNGAVIAFDTVSRQVDWAFSYPIPPSQEGGQQRFWGYNQVETVEPAGGAFIRDGLLYFKDKGSSMMYALDPSGPKLAWKRPVDADTSIVGMDEARFYLLSASQDNTFLMAVDAESGAPVKAAKLPDANEGVNALRAGMSYLVFLSRGIYAIDTANPDVTSDTKIFRGFDKDSLGGQLLRAGDKLISVSNLAVTAYPGREDAEAPSH